MEKENQILNDILDGKRKADDAPEIVQNWLKLTIYNLADSVARKPTKKARREAMDNVKKSHPLFYDDVSMLARKIYEDNHK